MKRSAVDWPAYLASFHDANPGVTEDLLADARDRRGHNPYDWLVEAVGGAETVVDVACGSGPLGRRLGGLRTIGVDRSKSELRRGSRAAPGSALVQAEATALPVAPTRADAVTVSMALMLFEPLDVFLAEAARVLRPGGILAATVPTRSSAHGPFAEILSALGQAGVPYPESLDAASLPPRFAAAGFRLSQDMMGAFTRSVTVDEAELVVRSFYAPQAAPALVAETAASLRRGAEREPLEVTYPIRRVVAERLGDSRV